MKVVAAAECLVVKINWIYLTFDLKDNLVYKSGV